MACVSSVHHSQKQMKLSESDRKGLCKNSGVACSILLNDFAEENKVEVNIHFVISLYIL